MQVLEAEPEGHSVHYLVHYNGWNNRYNEWIQKDRVFSVVAIPSDAQATKVKKSLMSKVNEGHTLVNGFQMM